MSACIDAYSCVKSCAVTGVVETTTAGDLIAERRAGDGDAALTFGAGVALRLRPAALADRPRGAGDLLGVRAFAAAAAAGLRATERARGGIVGDSGGSMGDPGVAVTCARTATSQLLNAMASLLEASLRRRRLSPGIDLLHDDIVLVCTPGVGTIATDVLWIAHWLSTALCGPAVVPTLVSDRLPGRRGSASVLGTAATAMVSSPSTHHQMTPVVAITTTDSRNTEYSKLCELTIDVAVSRDRGTECFIFDTLGTLWMSNSLSAVTALVRGAAVAREPGKWKAEV